MVPKALTLPQIRREGIEALVERLGPAGAIRFLQQFAPGEGDYTHDRHAWLDGLTVEEIAERTNARRGNP